MKQRPEHANKSVEDLRDLLSSGNSNLVLRDMSSYIANIPGTACYWKSACDELLAIIHCKKAPTLFGTFTFADHYDPYLHELFGIPERSSVHNIKEVLLNNSAIVEHYFVQKFKFFCDEVLVKLYSCKPELDGWFWGRAEWQHRGNIHYHFLLRLGDHLPDPYTLALKKVTK